MIISTSQVEYEETGWYDGQVFVKPPEVLARDRLLGSYEVRKKAGCDALTTHCTTCALLSVELDRAACPGNRTIPALFMLTLHQRMLSVRFITMLKRVSARCIVAWGLGELMLGCSAVGQARARASQNDPRGQRRSAAAQHGPPVRPHPRRL